MSTVTCQIKSENYQYIRCEYERKVEYISNQKHLIAFFSLNYQKFKIICNACKCAMKLALTEII